MTEVPMSIAQLFTQLESAAYDAEIGLASTPRAFVALVRKNPAYRSLIEALKSENHLVDRLVERCQLVAQNNIDRRYRNPFDAALASYGLAIIELRLDLGRIVADTIAAAPNLWWSVVVSNWLREPVALISGAGETPVEGAQARSVPRQATVRPMSSEPSPVVVSFESPTRRARYAESVGVRLTASNSQSSTILAVHGTDSPMMFRDFRIDSASRTTSEIAA